MDGSGIGEMLTETESHVWPEFKVKTRVATPASRHEGPVYDQESEKMAGGEGLGVQRMEQEITSTDRNKQTSCI